VKGDDLNLFWIMIGMVMMIVLITGLVTVRAALTTKQMKNGKKLMS
jgi:hypothetical protein